MSRFRIAIFGCTVVILAAALTAETAALDLVCDGQPTAVVVIAEGLDRQPAGRRGR